MSLHGVEHADPEAVARRILADIAANPRTYPWDGAPDFPEADMYVSEDEARWLQQRVDNALEREVS
jgi:hypothetical protein